MSEWISVIDKTPEKESTVLCFSSYGVVIALFFPRELIFQDCASGNDEGMQNWDDVAFKVTHWMPLPAPPKE